MGASATDPATKFSATRSFLKLPPRQPRKLSDASNNGSPTTTPTTEQPPTPPPLQVKPPAPKFPKHLTLAYIGIVWLLLLEDRSILQAAATAATLTTAPSRYASRRNSGEGADALSEDATPEISITDELHRIKRRKRRLDRVVADFDQWSDRLLRALVTGNGLEERDAVAVRQFPEKGVGIVDLVIVIEAHVKSAASDAPPSPTAPQNTIPYTLLTNLIFSALQQGMDGSAATPGEPATGLSYDARLRSVMRRLSYIIFGAVEKAESNLASADSSPTSPTAPIAPMGDKAMGLLSHEVERDAAHDLWKAATSPNSQISPKEDSPVTSTTSNDSPTSRWLKMGLVTLASGLMIGATGGLAAPYIAPSLATLFASMGLTIGVTTTGVGALFGVVGGGLTAYTLAQDSGIKEFRFHPVITQPKNSPALHVIVAVSGWGADISDLYDPWSIVPVFAPFSEVTAVICEPEIPVDLGRMLESHRDTHARRRSQPAEETQAEYIHQPTEPDPDFIEHTDLKPWRPHHDSAQSLSYSLHTAWLLALETAPKAGRHLAYILASKTHGSRPVTLIGTSIGALTIFECLVELGHRRAVGIVDSVFLLGAPIDASSTNAYKWCLARTVVAGRFVVGYSMKDKELRALMAQPEDANEDTGVQAGVDVTDVAGLGPVLIELRTVLPTDLSPDDRDFLEEDDDEAEPGRQQAEVSSTSTSDPFVSSFVGQELKPPQDITRPDSATFSDILLSPSIPTAKEPSTAFEPTHSSLPWPPLHRTLPLENVDLSRIIHYHIDYRDRIHAVLNAVGFERARPSEGGAGEERERGQEEAREEREVGEVLWDAGAE